MNRPPGTSREVELKLELQESDRATLARHPWLREIGEGRAATRTLESVYFDTAELSLWRKGLVLRVRSIGRRRILGVKTRGIERGGLVSRDECEVALPAAAGAASLVSAIPDERLRRAVERAAGGKPLRPRVETHFRRTTRRLRHGNAEIELALDVGEVRAGRRRIPIREVELELLRGPTRALYDVALRLSEDVTLRPATLGKAERGFRCLLGDEAKSSKSRRPEFPRGASLEEVLGVVLGEGLRQIAANQIAIERGSGAEGVHQMRVGVRRLRSALRLFRDQLPARETKALSSELRWLARALGEARDLDVFLGELLEPLAGRRPRDRGLAALQAAAERQREKAYASVRRTVASDRYATLLLRLGRFVDGGGFRRRAGAELERPARPLAKKLLRRRAARVLRLGERLDELTAPELHRLRIRAKRLRYATEQLAPLLDPEEAKHAARRLSALQDALGHLNDRAVAEELVKRLRPRTAGPEVARAERFVSDFAARSAARGRRRLERSWRRVAKLGAYWS
ncbi:MAG: CYTH and CHAD domain-containing protein [Myxococcota bacterium]